MGCTEVSLEFSSFESALTISFVLSSFESSSSSISSVEIMTPPTTFFDESFLGFFSLTDTSRTKLTNAFCIFCFSTLTLLFRSTSARSCSSTTSVPCQRASGIRFAIEALTFRLKIDSYESFDERGS